MAIPSTTMIFDEAMDPSDIADYVLDLTTLLEGDNVASYSLNLSADSILAGLTLGTGDYAPSLRGPTSLLLWFTVDASKQSSPLFDGGGVTLPLELTLTTTSTPPRRKQRTVAVKVAQR